MAEGRPALSVVVVTHDMERELPRTLQSLSASYQRNLQPVDYEIVVVDNGSRVPARVPPRSYAEARIALHRVGDPSPSPAAAANLGITAASADLIGLIVDGARMASPGLLAAAVRAAALSTTPVVTAPAFHLGGSGGPSSAEVEDALLAASGWPEDGYALFAISTPAPSSARGLFGPMGESSSLFMRRASWETLGGLDERFQLPGGGMVNHDLYRRACALPEAELVVLLGEGTFHQAHGGAATSGRITREAMRADYEAICGEGHRPPSNQPIYVGSMMPTYLPYLLESATKAYERGVRAGSERP